MSSWVGSPGFILTLCLTILIPEIKGSCQVDGIRYNNGTVWQSEACTVCTCHSPVPVCETVSCRHRRQCDFSRGGYLELQPGRCCPECKKPAKSCHYQGTTLPHNTEWSPRPCETCYCVNGQALCANNTCPELRCRAGELQQQLPGQCCPLCVPAGRSCVYDGDSHADGSEWSPLPCTKCICHSGHSQCYVEQCPPRHCQQGEELIQVEGSCCPQCVGPVCMDRDQHYQSGDWWQRDRCTHCLCRDGTMVCARQTCSQETPKCAQTEQLVWRSDQCCPVCVPKRGVCESDGRQHYAGDVWDQDQCQYCVCNNAEVQCTEAQCRRVQCEQNEELVHRDGECCPRCITHHQCQHAGHHYQHLETWSADPCTYCECHEGRTTCYSQPCQHCPVDTVRVDVPGTCCGQCKPVSCDYQCAGCHPSHPTYCTACRDESKVLQNGRCWDACSEGYYLEVNNECTACMDQCLNCTGSTQYHCSSCKPGYLLRDGQCVDQCGPGYLSQDDHTCIACHESCGTCSGGRRNHCLSCSVSWQVLKNGRCQDTCGDGYYRLPNNTCAVCTEQCYPCLHGYSGGCRGCQPGLYLQDTMCMPGCDMGYIQTGNTCQECPSRCMQCTDTAAAVCVQCSSRSYLQDAACVLHCDSTHFHNEVTRTCDAISGSPPVLYENNTIVATAQQISVVTPDMLQAHSEDTPHDQLVYRIITPPSNGKLLKVVGGQDEKLQGHGVMTFDDLQQGRLRFHHDPESPLTGYLELYVSGRQLGSSRQTVPILVTSQRGPELALNQPLFVQQGQKAVVNPECCLDIVDLDTGAAMEITVLQGPQHGRLTLKGTEGSVRVFTVTDLRDGALKYSHDGDDGRYDHALLQVSDGYNLLNFVFNIEVTPEDSAVPMLVHNNPAYVDPGQMVQITSEMLQARHQAGTVHDQDLIYTLTPPTNNPKHGELLMVVPLPAGGATDGWADLTNGMMGATMFRFLQRDLDEGRIWYRHKGGKEKDDYFIFEVSDGGNPPNLLLEQEYDITVTEPQADYPLNPLNPFSMQDVDYFSYGSDVPTIAPGVRLGMTVLENQLVPIRSADLEFEDMDTAVNDLRYHITEPLSWDDGTIEHMDRPFQAVSDFTQADINENKIIYRPPSQDVGQAKKTVKFKFMVEDGDNELDEQSFAINVIPVNNMPPKLANPKPSVEVTQGGTVPIRSEVIAVSDPDTALDSLIFTLEKNPVAGHFIKRDDNIKVMLRAGDTFTYSEILGNVFYYTHDGSDVMSDSLQLTVEDGVQSVPVSVQVKVIRVDKSAPLVGAETTMALTLPEGKSRVLNRTHLSFTDGDTPPSDLYLTLASDPMHGGLYLGDSAEQIKKGNSFSLADLGANLIKYTAEREVGIKPVSEVIYFNVTNRRGHVLPLQLFAVMITPVNNQPPIVSVGSGVELEEGGRITLTLEDISATDIDTPLAELAVFVNSRPSFGILDNTRTAEGVEAAGTKIVTSFTMQDLVDGHIHYVQNNHLNKEPSWDLFLFHVSDGVNTSPTSRFNISIVLTNDEPPMLITEQIFCQEGRGVLINNASMYVQDFDTLPGDLVFTVHEVPRHGELRLKDFPGDLVHLAPTLQTTDTFTYQDVLNEQFLYTHNGGDNQNTDVFTLSITDGKFSETKTFSVIVGMMNDETPRLQVNSGLRLKPGQTLPLGVTDLKVTDLDSKDGFLTYILTEAPSSGKLQLKKGERFVDLSAIGRNNRFTQGDIDGGRVQYVHTVGEPAGVFSFKFSVADQLDNTLLDQAFVITVFEDRIPPRVVNNKELRVEEGGEQLITTHHLSATDVDSQTGGDLTYRVVEGPSLGHLARLPQLDAVIQEFTQSDLAARSLQYVHTSDAETYMDHFIFTVTDGANEVTQKFYITILPVDDSLPTLTNTGLKVQEGVRKLITEFELKAVDLDSEDTSVQFELTRLPAHGLVELKQPDYTYRPTTTFTMADIYENRVTYRHDGSDTLRDAFKFTVSDSKHTEFVVTSELADDFTTSQAQPMSMVTDQVLLATDSDSLPNAISYHVTDPPRHGRLEHLETAGVPTLFFTQEDVNTRALRYVMSGNVSAHHDQFTFDVTDAKPNTLPDNVFHILWSTIEFEQLQYNVTESVGVVKVTVRRHGNLKQYSIVMCETVDGGATSQGRTPASRDFVKHVGQVQFDEWEDTKTCDIIVNDDGMFEGTESFSVVLTEPVYAVLGDRARAEVHILDMEDEPVVEFEHSMYSVNESSGVLQATLIRTGDTSSTSSVICYTDSMTAQGSSEVGLETGSDYKTRGRDIHNRVVFPPGVTMATCHVKIIDDTSYELTEQFELLLTEPSLYSRLGSRSEAIAMIEGPNDESTVSLSDVVYFTDELSGQLEIPVLRQGSDLSHTSKVWCATKMSSPHSATPGQDYIPSSRQVIFQPGQAQQVCTIELLDDAVDPRVEGNETLVIFLGSAVGSMLTEPQSALVIINDTSSDMPLMQFVKEAYVVDEEQGTVNIPVVRSGDLSYESSVICSTRQRSARVTLDFTERPQTEVSRIHFQPGDKVKNCSVVLVNDQGHEADEVFMVELTEAEGTDICDAGVGHPATATITITNSDDVPRIQVEHAAYSVHEPESAEDARSITVRVLRLGDRSQSARVRVSTRDGSAVSGQDYNARSQLLRFQPDSESINFTVEILYNPDIEWHETFTITLGPNQPSNAIFGDFISATVTILDNEVSGSLVLPAPPMVVSLLDYDNVEKGSSHHPSPGYPLVCVTPCDPHFPTFDLTRALCEKGEINNTAMLYKWEIAMPLDVDGSRPPFERVTDNTVFTSVNSKVLDSIYFRPQFHVRCMAQPLHRNGNLGVPLRSSIVTIGVHNGLCHTPITAGNPHGFHGQSFVATLKYIEPTDKEHPNSIQISVKVPHQDGMLPLVSTMPIHNLRFLLSEPVYRQQHVCSNFILPKERRRITRHGFITPRSRTKSLQRSLKKPYQFDTDLRSNETVRLYQHLDLQSCTWHFQGWYHMTELVDLCGGSVISDFEVRDAAQSYLTVQVPLHVSYLYAAAPTGWSSLEHRTEMEFSFFYSTVQWKAGLETDGSLSGRLQVLKVAVGPSGNLVMDFKTQAKFRGQYVLDHHTVPGVSSQVTPPDDLPLTFDLSLMWSQQTFDSPSQIWRATSNYNLRDYSGEYVVELIPCTVPATQAFTAAKDAPLVCTAHDTQQFVMPIAFQQTSRPVPLVYSLNTDFLLTSNPQLFLADPALEVNDLAGLDEGTVFNPGQKVYGRVTWDPSQDLDSAYTLQVQKLFICTGRDGYIPTFDPTGEVYEEGPQFGCMQPTTKLKHRLLVLDRGDPDVVDASFKQVPFNMQLVGEDPEYNILQQMPGVDGFAFSVDPLYKGAVGHQWYLQVIYSIGPAGKLTHRRYQRSASLSALHRLKRTSDPTEQRNGTNIHSLHLDASALEALQGGATSSAPARVVAPVVCVVVILVLILLCLLVVFYRRRKKHKEDEMVSMDTRQCRSRELYESYTGGATVRQSPPVHVRRTFRAHRNRWSLRPKSGTEV